MFQLKLAEEHIAVIFLAFGLASRESGEDEIVKAMMDMVSEVIDGQLKAQGLDVAQHFEDVNKKLEACADLVGTKRPKNGNLS